MAMMLVRNDFEFFYSEAFRPQSVFKDIDLTIILFNSSSVLQTHIFDWRNYVVSVVVPRTYITNNWLFRSTNPSIKNAKN